MTHPLLSLRSVSKIFTAGCAMIGDDSLQLARPWLGMVTRPGTPFARLVR